MKGAPVVECDAATGKSVRKVTSSDQSGLTLRVGPGDKVFWENGTSYSLTWAELGAMTANEVRTRDDVEQDMHRGAIPSMVPMRD